MRIPLLIGLLFLVSVGFATWRSSKNEERKEPSLEQRWERSDIVVLGKVIEQKLIPAPFRDYDYLSAIETKLKVKRKWKGDIEKDEVLSFYMLSDQTHLGPLYTQFTNFDMGRDYILFCHVHQEYSLNFRSYSKPMEDNEASRVFSEIWAFLDEQSK